jgi:hypothetical protein
LIPPGIPGSSDSRQEYRAPKRWGRDGSQLSQTLRMAIGQLLQSQDFMVNGRKQRHYGLPVIKMLYHRGPI